MRVIAGEFKGRKLKSLTGDNTRPTTDKVKESLFNIIGPYFNGGVVLDLFSGSGSLAIEAVSRGADQAVCIEKNFQAIKVIKDNIAITKAEEKFVVMKQDANRALVQFGEEGRVFDLIFLDPPYAQQQIVSQIEQMIHKHLVKEGSLIVCETDKNVHLPEVIPGVFVKKRQVYGMTEMVIYERGEE